MPAVSVPIGRSPTSSTPTRGRGGRSSERSERETVPTPGRGGGQEVAVQRTGTGGRVTPPTPPEAGTSPFGGLPLFNELSSGTLAPFSRAMSDFWGEEDYYTIPVDVKENDKDWVVQADLPGCQKGDVDVTVAGQVLTIGVRCKEAPAGTTEATEQGTPRYFRMERPRCTRYTPRRLRLPQSCNTQTNVEASMADGILTVHMPKKKSAIPHAINVK